MIRRTISTLGVVLILAACSGSPGASPTASTGPAGTAASPAGGSPAAGLKAASLRLDFLPGGTQAPFFLALDRGYYRDEGIDLTIGDGRGSGVTVQAVGSGQDTFGFAATSAVASAVAQGIPVKSIGMITNRNSYALFAANGSGIGTIADMCGKRILAAAGGPDTFYTQAVLAINGLPKDCATLQNVDPAAKISSYVQGQGDGMVTVVPFGSFPVQKGRPSKVLLFADNGLVALDFGMITSTGLIQSDPGLVQGFVRASLKGWDDAQKDPAAAAAAVVKYRPNVPPDQALDQVKLQLTFLASNRDQGKPIGCVAAQDWVDTLKLLHDYGGLKTDPTKASDYYTNQFIAGCS